MTPLSDSRNSDNAAYWRGLFTIAEDALRAIASPDCGLEWDEEHAGYEYDSGAERRIAEGALRRLNEARCD